MLEARTRRWAPILILSAAAVLLTADMRELAARYDRYDFCKADSDFNMEAGEALIHGVEVSPGITPEWSVPGSPYTRVSWSMPAYTVSNALLCQHSPRGLPAAAVAATCVALAALLFALGCFLQSSLCGAVAVLFLAVVLRRPDGICDRWLYVIPMALTACATVWRARRPSVGRSLLVGASVGMSLLVLSPLFLFPAALLAYEIAARRIRCWGEGLKHGAALCLTPWLFLVPWTAMNWTLHHRISPLELGRADEGYIEGALGEVFATEGKFYDLREYSGFHGNRSALGWAAVETLRHPWRSLSAFASRAVEYISPHPALMLLALVACWVFRRREEHRQLALLTAYYFLIHCTMPVAQKYFAPLWPLVAVLAACLVDIGRRSGPPAWGERLLPRAACAAAAPLIALELYALCLVCAYPGRAAAADAYDRELARNPRDSWLFAERGARMLERGFPTRAAADLDYAFSLDPELHGFKYALALTLAGESPRLVMDLTADRPRSRMFEWLDKRALRALLHLTTGADPVAAQYLSLAGHPILRKCRETGCEKDWKANVPGMEANVSRLTTKALARLLTCWPVAERAPLLDKLSGMARSNRKLALDRDGLAQSWLDLALKAREVGMLETARKALRMIEPTAKLAPDQKQALAGLRAQFGLPPQHDAAQKSFHTAR